MGGRKEERQQGQAEQGAAAPSKHGGGKSREPAGADQLEQESHGCPRTASAFIAASAAATRTASEAASRTRTTPDTTGGSMPRVSGSGRGQPLSSHCQAPRPAVSASASRVVMVSFWGRRAAREASLAMHAAQ